MKKDHAVRQKKWGKNNQTKTKNPIILKASLKEAKNVRYENRYKTRHHKIRRKENTKWD